MERGGIIFINLARCQALSKMCILVAYKNIKQNPSERALFFCEHILFQDKKKHTCLFLKKKVEKKVLFPTIEPAVVHIH